MKLIKTFFIFVTVIFMFSCSNSGSGSGSGANKPVNITKAEFIAKVFDFEKNKEWLYTGTVPCVVDFYADWCKPCKMVAPIMDELAAKYAGKVVFYKINIDNEKELAQAFGVESIPTVLFIPMKGQPQMSVGAMSKEDYTKAIDNLLAPVAAGQTSLK